LTFGFDLGRKIGAQETTQGVRTENDLLPPRMSYNPHVILELITFRSKCMRKAAHLHVKHTPCLRKAVQNYFS